jgi:Na+(H+)/acetate symporter ActP
VPALFLLAVWLGDGAPSPAEGTAGGLTGSAWSDPSVTSAGATGLGLYTTYSIIVATFLGTVGLPHVVVRFYTNPDGRQARRTTLVVLALLGLFYVLPPVYAALGRLYAPDLVAAGPADSVVLTLPGRMVGAALGDSLAALTADGAFASLLSPWGGLTVAVAGVLSQELQRRRQRGSSTVRDPRAGVRPFQAAAVVALAVPLLVALAVQGVGVAEAVGLAFAFAASTLAPLILLGIWWRRLTDVGALAGMGVGGLGAGAAIIDTWIGPEHSGWTDVLLTHPAAWSAPLAFGTMVVVSLLTSRRVPLQVDTTMVRLHTPESVPLDRGPALR